MRTIQIVADSSCDLLTLEGVAFSSAPMKILTNDCEFVDDASLDVDATVQYFDQYKGRARTSCPNPSDWLDAFGDADDVICVTITGGLSGSYNTACAAKQLYETEHPDRRVFVLDSLSAGAEVTMLVRRLAQGVRSGLDFPTLCDDIRAYATKTRLVFMLKSLRNFANNGRVSPLVAKLVGFAGVCIVGKASDEGTLEPLHKCRGEDRALEALINDMKELGWHRGRVSIGHCQNESGALKLRDKLRSHVNGAEIDVHPLRGLCSFYAEKGGLLVGFETT